MVERARPYLGIILKSDFYSFFFFFFFLVNYIFQLVLNSKLPHRPSQELYQLLYHLAFFVLVNFLHFLKVLVFVICFRSHIGILEMGLLR